MVGAELQAETVLGLSTSVTGGSCIVDQKVEWSAP